MWPDSIDSTERCRRLIDLFLVSVLLDAGAGTQWSYKSVENGRTYRRSEGLAVASLEMFKEVLIPGQSQSLADVKALIILQGPLLRQSAKQISGRQGWTQGAHRPNARDCPAIAAWQRAGWLTGPYRPSQQAVHCTGGED